MRGLAAAALLAALAIQGARAEPPALASLHEQATRLAASLRQDWASHGQVGRDVTEPFIVSGKMLKTKLDVTKAPALPQLSLTLNAGTVGVSYVTIALVAPSGAHYLTSTNFMPAYPPQPQTGTVSFEVSPASAAGAFGQGIGLYAEPGIWRLSSIALISSDGTLIPYDSGQLAALFPSTAVQVTNKTPDVTAPTAGAGSILTPNVVLSSASPFFAVNLAVADERSGVASVTVAFVGPPGSNAYLGARTALTLPVASGTVTPYARLPLGTITGTYTITSFSVCDAAGNCLIKTQPSDMTATFGTTTFQVNN